MTSRNPKEGRLEDENLWGDLILLQGEQQLAWKAPEVNQIGRPTPGVRPHGSFGKQIRSTSLPSLGRERGQSHPHVPKVEEP